MTKIKLFTFITLLITSSFAFSANKKHLTLPGDNFDTKTSESVSESIPITFHLGKSWSPLTYPEVISAFQANQNQNPLTDLAINETKNSLVFLDNYNTGVLLVLKDKPSETIFNVTSQSKDVSYGNFENVNCNLFFAKVESASQKKTYSDKKTIQFLYSQLYIDDLYKEPVSNSECLNKDNRLKTTFQYVISKQEGKINLMNNNGIGLNDQKIFKINDHQFFIFIPTTIFKKDAQGTVNYLYYFLELKL